MTDGTIHEFQPRFDGFSADLLHLFLVAQPFDVLVRAEFEIDLVRVIDEFLRKIVSYEFGQLAAHLVGKGPPRRKGKVCRPRTRPLPKSPW